MSARALWDHLAAGKVPIEAQSRSRRFWGERPLQALRQSIDLVVMPALGK